MKLSTLKEDEDEVAVSVKRDVKGVAKVDLDIRLSASTSALNLINVIYDQISHLDLPSIQIRVFDHLFYPTEDQTIGDYARKNEIFLSIRDTLLDAGDIELYRRVLWNGNNFKKYVKGIPTNRFIRCNPELTKVTWSVSQQAYNKGETKGEISIKDLSHVLGGKSNISLYPNQFGTTQWSSILGQRSVEANCFSLLGKGEKSLYLESRNFLSMKIHCEAFAWLIEQESKKNLLHGEFLLPSEVEISKSLSPSDIMSRMSLPLNENSINGNVQKLYNNFIANDSQNKIFFEVESEMTTSPSKGILKKSGSHGRNKSNSNLSEIDTPGFTFSRVPSGGKMEGSSSAIRASHARNTSKELHKSNSLKQMGNAEQIHNVVFRLTDQVLAALAIIESSNEEKMNEINHERNKEILEVSINKLNNCLEKLMNATKVNASELFSKGGDKKIKNKVSVATKTSNLQEVKIFEYLLDELKERRMEDTRHLELQSEITAKEIEINKLSHYVNNGSGGVCSRCARSLVTNTVETNQISSSPTIESLPDPVISENINNDNINNINQESESTQTFILEAFMPSGSNFLSVETNINTKISNSDKTIEETTEGGDSVIESVVPYTFTSLKNENRKKSSKRMSYSDLEKSYISLISKELNNMFSLNIITWVVFSYIEGISGTNNLNLKIIASGRGNGTSIGKYFQSDQVAYAILKVEADNRPSGIFITWIGEEVNGISRAKVPFHESKIINDVVAKETNITAMLRPTCIAEVEPSALLQGAQYATKKIGIKKINLDLE